MLVVQTGVYGSLGGALARSRVLAQLAVFWIPVNLFNIMRFTSGSNVPRQLLSVHKHNRGSNVPKQLLSLLKTQ
jgi:hypothetical protein